MIPRALLLCGLVLTTGCGFHLQGRAALPAVLAAAHIDASDNQSDFYAGLRDALRASGSTLQESAVAGAANIRILSDGTAERVLTVSSRNLPTAYALTYSVRLTVNAGGRELLPAETFSATREYSFDATALLAKERERQSLSAALADELVSEVMSRLASLSAAD